MGDKQRNFRFHDSRTGAAITVRITPRASKNEINEILDDGTIKVRLKAGTPDENINKELTKFLSGVLDVPASKIEIVAGDTGMDKLVTIVGMEARQVQSKILERINLD